MEYRSKTAVEARRKFDANGVSTADLERKVFSATGADTGMANVRQLEQDVQRYQRALQQIGLEQYDGVTRTVVGALEGVGIPALQWMQRQEQRKLEGVVQTLQDKREGYERDIQTRERELTRWTDIQDSAGLLLERYQAQMVDIKTAVQEAVPRYRSARQEAKTTDSNAHRALRDDIHKLNADYRTLKQRSERAAAKVVEASANIEMLSGIQDHAYAMLQTVEESELRAKGSLSQTKIVDSSSLGLPQTVRSIADAEVVGAKVRTRTGKVTEATMQVVERIHGYEHGFSNPERDAERQRGLRQAVEERKDAFLDQALRILENDELQVH